MKENRISRQKVSEKMSHIFAETFCEMLKAAAEAPKMKLSDSDVKKFWKKLYDDPLDVSCVKYQKPVDMFGCDKWHRIYSDYNIPTLSSWGISH